MKLYINYDLCCWKDGKCTSCACGGACEGCVEVCPVDALKREDKLIIDHDKCIICGVCVDACKYNALNLK